MGLQVFAVGQQVADNERTHFARMDIYKTVCCVLMKCLVQFTKMNVQRCSPAVKGHKYTVVTCMLQEVLLFTLFYLLLSLLYFINIHNF